MYPKNTMVLDESPSTMSSTVPLNIPAEGKFGVRQVQAILIFLCFFTAFFLRINLSFAIVPMTNKNSSNSDFEEFDWDEKTKGNILSAFFWGYLVIQVPAGMLGQVISPKKLFLVTNTLCSILTMLIPFSAHYGGWILVCIIRVLQGLCQGFYVPLTYILASKWAPLTEQNRFIGFTLNGGTLGATAVMPLSGLLASSRGGWPSIFYVSGVLGIFWVIIYMWFGADSPATHKTISQSEREFIQSSLQHNSDQTLPTPWHDILTSPPLWALVAAHIGCGWSFSIIFTEMPSYINSVLGFNIETNGYLSALPYLTMWCLSYPVCWLADIMYKHKVCSTTKQRKIWATISGTVAALVLFSVGFVGRNAIAAMALLILAVSLSSCAFSGFYVNSLDLAPNFAGILTGIGNGLENISSILAPLTCGWIITDDKSVEQWTLAFLTSVFVAVSGNVIFLIWGTAELQPWNEPKTSSKNQKIDPTSVFVSST